MGRRLIAALALLAGQACSSYGTDEPPAAPDASAPDASTGDAGMPPVVDARSDASIPAAETGAPITNLLSAQESDFEGGSEMQCADGTFTTYRATHVKDATNAYTGKWSCRICSTGPEPFFTLDASNIAENPPIGARYRATARVRAATYAAGALQRMRIVLRSQSAAKEDVETSSSQSTELTAQWTQLSTAITLTKSAARVDLYVASDGPSGSCFLVDDIVAWQE